jgi:mannitol/fructose-specific phosphotransferase system IIA component (Ntr-type)
MVFTLSQEAVSIIKEPIEKEDALYKIIHLVSSAYNIDREQEIQDLIIERESRLSTGIGLGIAVPHCRLDDLDGIYAGVMLIPGGIEYNSVDGQPVKLIFLILSSTAEIRGHIASLSAISHAVSDENTRLKLLSAKNREDLYTNLVDNLEY